MGLDPEAVHETDPTAVLVEATDAAALAQALERVPKIHVRQVVQLNDHLLSVDAGEAALDILLAHRGVQRIQTKKKKRPHLDRASVDIGLRGRLAGPRAVAEDGTGVLIGIIDSGFDLSHPMFRDAGGNLRVEGLLWQRGSQGPRQYTTQQLNTGWRNGSNPGADENGHGTHVATIAGGRAYQGVEGVAPGARFLLVKTDFVNTTRL